MADENPQQPEKPQQAEQPENPDSPDQSGHDDTGLDLARSVARGLAGKTPARKPTSLAARRRRAQDAAISGAHPDERDPQTLDVSLGRMVAEQGWATELRVHGVFSRWPAIVGSEVADHVTPESFANGRLTVRTDSTAWATQMKLLAADMVLRLNDVLGEGTVLVIDVQGPRPPSWRRGRLRVKGRGPRDTYG